MKNKKHDKIITDYDKIKSKRLEKIATDMIEKDDIFQKLKEKIVEGKFLDEF